MELYNAENEEKSNIPVYVPEKPLMQKSALREYLINNTMEYLKGLYKFFFGKSTTLHKAELINALAAHLTFPTEKKFKEWFFALPPTIQKILHRGMFADYVPVQVLEKELGISLVEKNTRYSWQNEWKFKPEFDLGVIPLINFRACPFITVPVFLWEVLSPWLLPPASARLAECRIPDQTDAWDNSVLIADAFPLICDALELALEGMGTISPEKIARSGFKKKEIGELQASTGFLPFKMEGEEAPSGIELASRFILCMHGFIPRRPSDGQEGIREMVQNFFSAKSQYPKSWYFPDRAFLEYNICIDHLSRVSGTYFDNQNTLPLSRSFFMEILLHVAKDGNWFDADKLAEYIKISRNNFSFCDQYMLGKLKVKAESFEVDSIVFISDYDEEFNPEGIMRFSLLTRPLFKAYCYIFASLGLLEITQESPPLPRSYRKKQYPFSVYDSLKAIRITEFGRWCLGLTDKRPPRPAQNYQAIADRELLLVTVQGNSLERRVYLDKIGQRLGEDRWRISPASFISGCMNKRQIAERIERFKQLIDENPAPHWEQLFKKVIDRAGLFDARRSDLYIFDLPADRELQDELLRDPEFKRIVRRVEGRMVAVAVKEHAKFFALLGEHGIAHF